MPRLRPLGLPVFLLCLPGTAPAQRAPEPLVDLAPRSTAFADHVGPTPATARAAGDSPWVAHSAPDGQAVLVRFAAGLGPDDAVAQTYVDFLGSLVHGTELGRLRVVIGTLDAVRRRCGGQPGTLACYDPGASRMTVPGEQVVDEGDGVTTSYVVAHEYGHHIARWRSNPPFGAITMGPKRWASQEMVCLNALRGRLFPGDQGENYLANPGEAWADTFAHLRYPDTGWQYTPLLEPTLASFRAALLDVGDPWKEPEQRSFTGTFTPDGTDVALFEFVLRLDGSLRVELDGPPGAEYDLLLRSLGERQGRTRAPGADDVFALPYACREVAAERVRVAVLRRAGSGPFSLTVTYAG